MDPRLAALVTLLGALVLGGILAAVVRGLAARTERAGAARQRGLGRTTFGIVALVGVVAALAVLDEEALEGVPEQALAFVPRVIGAGVLLIAGWLLANLLARLVDQAVLRGTGRQMLLPAATARWSVLGVAVVLALGELGIETTFLAILAAVVLGAIGLAAALVAWRAGGDLAREASHGRYLRRHLAVGDHVEGDGFAGRVARVDAATLVLEDGGAEVWVPNSRVVGERVRVTRAGRP